MAKQLLPQVVAQGEHLEKLAFLHGFDAREVWKDPKNDAIRALRKDPLVLAPGDIVYVSSAGHADMRDVMNSIANILSLGTTGAIIAVTAVP